MTTVHLFFAIMTSAYIVIGTYLEERDLRTVHSEYDPYGRTVPRYSPRLTGKRGTASQPV